MHSAADFVDFSDCVPTARLKLLTIWFFGIESRQWVSECMRGRVCVCSVGAFDLARVIIFSGRM